MTSSRRSGPLEPLAPRDEEDGDELSHFFAQSLDLLCVADLDGCFKRLNPAWTKVLGWPLDQLEARPFLDFVHPEDRRATRAEIAKLAGRANSISFENRYRRQDGSYRWLRWSVRPLRGGPQISVMGRDVTRQKRLEREVLEIVDSERERLGRELHDGLCQSLAGISALSSTLSVRLAARSEPAASAAAAEIAALLNDSIAEARGLARGLAPVGLKDRGLGGALEALATNIRQLSRVSCVFERKGPCPRLRDEAQVHLFRIAQEAVNNAVAHSRAQRIEISLRHEGRRGLLSVQDDGVGLSQEASGCEGMGLHTMAYRSRLIGALLEVRQQAGRGTAVTCAFPLPDRTRG